MSIQIRCPNGCSIVSAEKSKGKIIVCSECNSSIRVPRTADLIDGKSLFSAKLIAEPGELESEFGNKRGNNHGGNSRDDLTPPIQSESKQANLDVDALAKPFSPSELINSPQRIHKRASAEPPRTREVPSEEHPFDFLAKKASTTELETSEILPLIVDKKPESDLGEVVIELDQKEHIKHDPEKDRIWLTRFYAACLFIFGLVNSLPVLVLCIAQRTETGDSVLPRWAFVLIFLSMTFLAYAVYLLQLTDWASLLVVSIFVLLVACAYGFIAAGLWLGNANGNIAMMLQLPHSYYRFGPIWCGIMFCLSVLASFTFGRDALVWQRNSAARQLAI